jgi:hypothetical protein
VSKPVVAPPRPQRPPYDPAAATCTSTSLAVQFRAGTYGTGMDFASVWIWNPHRQPCTVRGRVSFAAYLADGTRDGMAATDRQVALWPTTLPARMRPPTSLSGADDYLTMLFAGAERDDATRPDGLCRAEDEERPVTLVVTLGALVIRARNANASGQGLYGCHGNVWLAAVSGPLVD